VAPLRRPDRLAAAAGRALLARGESLAVAESCTGGLLGALITSVPGSSRWFLGGVVAYRNAVKTGLLGVPPAQLRRHGAVSAPVAAAMAAGARRALRSSLALAVTGIAGPGGGTAAKPVGLVHVALSARGGSVLRRAVLRGSRQAVRAQAVAMALNLLLEHLGDER
jgi:PncC family amidohydrolase